MMKTNERIVVDRLDRFVVPEDVYSGLVHTKSTSS